MNLIYRIKFYINLFYWASSDCKSCHTLTIFVFLTLFEFSFFLRIVVMLLYLTLLLQYYLGKSSVFVFLKCLNLFVQKCLFDCSNYFVKMLKRLVYQIINTKYAIVLAKCRETWLI